MNPLFLLLIPFIFLFAWLRRSDQYSQYGWGKRILIGCIYGGAVILYGCALFNYDPWMLSDMYDQMAGWFASRFVPSS